MDHEQPPANQPPPPAQQSMNSGPPYTQPVSPQEEHNPSESGFFQALFDLRFTSFITIRFASLIYVLNIAFAALGYVTAIIIAGIVGGISLSVVTILFGWIPAAIQIIATRVVLEFFVANIRTAINTKH